MMPVNKQWILTSYPSGDVSRENFDYQETTIPDLQEGEFLVRHIYLSVDPTNRLWSGEKESYLPPVELGTPMRGVGIGIVERSRNEHFTPGCFVSGLLGWQTYLVSDGEGIGLLRVEDGIPLTAYHGMFGSIGMTAYFGLMDIGQPRRGDTLVVSAAAGAVGSLVGQLGKRVGCRVVGIAGSDEKCLWLTEELGFDAAINYKTQAVAEGLERHCPEGIDIYFDNVGGEILDAALGLINVGARVPLCGMISAYNDSEPQPGPKNMINILIKRATLKGYIVIDYMPRMKEAMDYLAAAYRAGEIKYRVDVLDGIDKVPDALSMLFSGANQGKLIVQLDPEWREKQY